MKILVISDTHRVTAKLKDLLEIINKDCEYVFHLGDCVDDILPFIKRYPNLNFHFVRGNCDFNGDVEENDFVDIEGKKIWLSHGHKHGVKFNYNSISYAAEERQVDVCLFGHTHDPEIFYHNNILYMNPGSMTMPRGKISSPTYGILDVQDNGEITPQIVAIRGKKLYKVVNL